MNNIGDGNDQVSQEGPYELPMSADGEIIEEIGAHQRGVVSLLGGVFVISPSDPSELADAMIRNRAENTQH